MFSSLKAVKEKTNLTTISFYFKKTWKNQVFFLRAKLEVTCNLFIDK